MPTNHIAMPAPTTPDCLQLVIEREERRAVVRGALRAMSSLEQQVLLRRVCGGQPFPQLSRDLGIDPLAARTCFANACLRLEGGQRSAICDGEHSSRPPAHRNAQPAEHHPLQAPSTIGPARRPTAVAGTESRPAA
jgi:hypothetical protein